MQSAGHYQQGTTDRVGVSSNHHIYLKLMIDGTPSPPFSAETLAPAEIAHLL